MDDNFNETNHGPEGINKSKERALSFETRVSCFLQNGGEITVIGDFKICHKRQGHNLDDQIDIFGTRFDFLRNQGLSQEDRLLKRNQNDFGRDDRDTGASFKLRMFLGCFHRFLGFLTATVNCLVPCLNHPVDFHAAL